jgi:hypothetical protein
MRADDDTYEGPAGLLARLQRGGVEFLVQENPTVVGQVVETRVHFDTSVVTRESSRSVDSPSESVNPYHQRVETN